MLWRCPLWGLHDPFCCFFCGRADYLGALIGRTSSWSGWLSGPASYDGCLPSSRKGWVLVQLVTWLRASHVCYQPIGGQGMSLWLCWLWGLCWLGQVPASFWEVLGPIAAGCMAQVGRSSHSAHNLEGGLQNGTCQHQGPHSRISLQKWLPPASLPQRNCPLPPASPGVSPEWACWSDPGFFQLTGSALGLRACEVCMCFLRAETLFPVALWVSHMQVLLTFKARHSGSSSVFLVQGHTPPSFCNFFLSVFLFGWFLFLNTC